MNDPETLRPLKITSKKEIARDIHLLEIQDASGAALQAFTAGAHIAVRVPSGAMRQYSLCNDPAETDRYQIAVKRDAQGRGGSMSLVDGLAQGDELLVGNPVNLFGLDDKAKNFLLVAGGIGITPMLSMVRHLKREGARNFRLFYLTRDPESTAFLEELSGDEFRPNVVIHHDHGDPNGSYDLWGVLEKAIPGTHVYCCGPAGLMNAVRDMTGHWPTSAIHFESFGADVKPHVDDKPFEVRLERSGLTVRVGSTQTILDAARRAGVWVSSSCESGTCGSCKVRLLEGQADHRDLVLLDEEKDDQIMVCVSRAKSDKLVLDL